jgi:hypothetical protein
VDSVAGSASSAGCLFTGYECVGQIVTAGLAQPSGQLLFFERGSHVLMARLGQRGAEIAYLVAASVAKVAPGPKKRLSPPESKPISDNLGAGLSLLRRARRG